MAEAELWISVTCIIIGLLLILLEVFNPGFFIAVPGTVLLGFGFASLAAPGFFYGQGAAWAIPIFGIPATVLTIWAYKKWAPPGDRPITLSNDSLPGHTGTVEKDIPAGGFGRAKVEGQSLRATSTDALAAGDKITVVSVEGLTITVEKQHGN